MPDLPGLVELRGRTIPDQLRYLATRLDPPNHWRGIELGAAIRLRSIADQLDGEGSTSNRRRTPMPDHLGIGEEVGPCEAWPHSPALVYVASDGTRVQIDAADPGILSPRDRALCAALVRLSLKRLEEDTGA